tara:strand:+ start:3543 stop:4460 length:918 start_codon:yes stop_codon:yes gene_type:complete
LNKIHTFTGNNLNRGDSIRYDEKKLDKLLQSIKAKFLPFYELNPLIEYTETPKLGWLSNTEFSDMKEFKIITKPIFLGFDENESPNFAFSINKKIDLKKKLKRNLVHIDSREIATEISQHETGILAQAKSNIEWNKKNKFCSSCSNELKSFRGGIMKKCLKCSMEHFPRTDPVVIMLVYKDEKCVLGQTRIRQRNGFYSCLAGFMDQGESIEEAVRREVQEESGLDVGKIQYHSSQPWPFPSSLMIGCHAEAINEKIIIDKNEMTDVKWFPKEEVILALKNKSKILNIPGTVAIAHHLIKAWAHN